ncbi:MAG: hypothetical protein K8J31_23130, partial [Anaerolineae bacterium]|nr:hypothetical protein [Anaerolineae bacterium]
MYEYEQETMQLRALATSNNPELLAHYRAICERRDGILTEAVTAISHTLLSQSGYQRDLDQPSIENYQQAL